MVNKRREIWEQAFPYSAIITLLFRSLYLKSMIFFLLPATVTPKKKTNSPISYSNNPLLLPTKTRKVNTLQFLTWRLGPHAMISTMKRYVRAAGYAGCIANKQTLARTSTFSISYDLKLGFLCHDRYVRRYPAAEDCQLPDVEDPLLFLVLMGLFP